MYDKEVSRTYPTAILFVIDQSGSMQQELYSGQKKAQVVADNINRTIYELITRCTKADGIRDYFDIGVLGYGAYPNKSPDALIQSLGDHNNHGVINCLNTNQILTPLSQVQEAVIRLEDRTKKVSDGAGGLVETSVKFPIWVDPYFNGGTPMYNALINAAQALAAWCDNHEESFPPIILHITDGEATDTGDDDSLLVELAENIKSLKTNDGNLLLFNLHISELLNDPIKYPSSASNLPNDYAKLLFEMSSDFPKKMLDFANSLTGMQLQEGAKGFLFNGKAEDIINFIEIGTKVAQSTVPAVPDESL